MVGEGLSPRVRGNRATSQYPRAASCTVYPRVCGGTLPTNDLCGFDRGKVYPRVCGGTAMSPTRPWRAAGLSPRVRGNPIPDTSTGRDTGSIPACAGEPQRRPSRTGPGRVYPRVCGGTPPVRVCSLWLWVYPRVCGGTPQPLGRNGEYLGSIPACAGEPHVRAQRRYTCRVYPRVCGGTMATGSSFTNQEGLSPRVRGNRVLACGLIAAKRSIPACAGEPT